MNPTDIPLHPPHEIRARHAQIVPTLHLVERDASSVTPGLILSHWIDWEMWDRIKEWFIEVEEGDWVCSEANATAVEEALQILPANRLAARRVPQADMTA